MRFLVGFGMPGRAYEDDESTLPIAVQRKLDRERRAKQPTPPPQPFLLLSLQFLCTVSAEATRWGQVLCERLSRPLRV